MSMRQVVITGIGVVSPLGIGAEAFWNNLITGTSAVRRIDAWDPSGFPSQIGGQAPPYKIGDFVPKSYRKATKVMARDIELAVIAADGAFKDAAIASKAYSDTPDIDPRRFGCNIGAGLISTDLNELTSAMTTSRATDDPNALDLEQWGTHGMNQLTPLWLLKYLPNMLACHVTIIHGLKGPSNTLTCADASSHLAIGEAFRTIQRGDADLAICGGAESKINPMGMVRQCLLNRLTERNDDPQHAVRPFDADATGTAIAEGGGLFILEELEHAKARGAKIYAELAGFGASQDTHDIITPAPDGRAYAKAIQNALADANLPPAAVDLLVPHGLGLPSHDRAELSGLLQVFGGGLGRIGFSPIKAQTGSSGAGSGQDAAAAVLGLHHNTLPPAVNTRTILDAQSLNTAPQARPAKVNVSISSVYSLGGQNAALVFRKLS